MPNQCLRCGTVIPSGSPAILNGCPMCGGRKFFYTTQPVAEAERLRLTEKANRDLNSLVKEILSQKPPVDSQEVTEPKETEKRIIEDQKPEIELEVGKEIEGREVDTIEDEWLEFKFDKPTKSVQILKRAKKPPKKPAARRALVVEKEKKPEIITIVEPGVYEIDLERLLDHCPIVVQSDGTYLVHIPSLVDKRYPWTGHQVFELLHKIEKRL